MYHPPRKNDAVSFKALVLPLQVREDGVAECASLHPGRAPHPPHNSHGQPLDGGTAGHRHGGQGGALHSPVILSHTLAQYTIVTLSVIYLVNIILSGKLFPTYFTFKFS